MLPAATNHLLECFILLVLVSGVCSEDGAGQLMRETHEVAIEFPDAVERIAGRARGTPYL